MPAAKAKARTRTQAKRGYRHKRIVDPADSRFAESLGHAVKAKRIAKTMTADELARSLSITANTQYQRESGRLPISGDELNRYARALGCKPSDLVKAAEAGI